MDLIPSSWSVVFAPETPILELVVRAVIMYVAILAFLRVMPRRTGGEVAHMDLIFMLLIAEAATHSLGDYKSVGDGMVVIASFMVLDYALNALSFRFPWIEKLTTAKPLQVVRDGKPLHENMGREFLTEEELMSYLRQNGIDDMSNVKIAMVEGKGKISIVPLKS